MITMRVAGHAISISGGKWTGSDDSLVELAENISERVSFGRYFPDRDKALAVEVANELRVDSVDMSLHVPPSDPTPGTVY
jgi:hypothetical protein